MSQDSTADAFAVADAAYRVWIAKTGFMLVILWIGEPI